MVRSLTRWPLAVACLVAARPALAAPPIRFACTATGEKLVAPATSAAAICGRFGATLARAAGIGLRADPGRFATDDPAPWIRVTLRFTKAGVASARVERSDAGRVIVYPDSSVAVSDRVIGLQAVDLLARDVASAIDAARRRR